jgi:hypothetical protein
VNKCKAYTQDHYTLAAGKPSCLFKFDALLSKGALYLEFVAALLLKPEKYIPNEHGIRIDC